MRYCVRIPHTHAGREIAKFMAAVQAAVYGSHEPTLTPEIWESVLARKLHEHQERAAFKWVWELCKLAWKGGPGPAMLGG